MGMIFTKDATTVATVLSERRRIQAEFLHKGRHNIKKGSSISFQTKSFIHRSEDVCFSSQSRFAWGDDLNLRMGGKL